MMLRQQFRVMLLQLWNNSLRGRSRWNQPEPISFTFG